MTYVSPENLQPSGQVIGISRVKPDGSGFAVDCIVRQPFTGEVKEFSLTVPRDVQASDPLWESITAVFKELFPRREHMLVYRDALRTRIIEEVFARTKKPKPKLDKEAIRARAAAARAEAAGAPTTEQAAPASEEPTIEQVRTLLAQAKEFERQAGDAMLDGKERKKAEIRARAFRTKAEKLVREARIDLSSFA